ncbi:hypothetical protein [Nakamurella deserti]|uniref:hypothetical protein n=1 Tax=Nakamurella deserti TaxID=2164074 RepID=UPI00130038F6|nr:hypothetical protein [Nakamurella deserti]
MTTPIPGSRAGVPVVLGVAVLMLSGCAGTRTPQSSAPTGSAPPVTTTVEPAESAEVPTADNSPVEVPPAEDPAAVTTGGRVIESLDEARRIFGDSGDASLPHSFLDTYVTDHGDEYAGYVGTGGAEGVTAGVLYLLASHPVISDELQEGIDLARERGMTITIEERELSKNALWSIADHIVADPDWPRAVIMWGVDVRAGQAVVGLDDRLAPDDFERIRVGIVARYSPHVRVKSAAMAQTGDGSRAGTASTG